MRRPLEWALWSPRHAVSVLAFMALLVVGTLVAALTMGEGDAPRATPTLTTTATGTPTTTTSPAPQGTPTTTAATKGERDSVPTDPDKAQAQAEAAAHAFMAGWLKGRTSAHDSWMQSMRPLVAPAFVPYLDMTPAAAIPDTKVKKWGEAVPGVDYSTIPLVLADGSKVELEIITWDSKWVVSGMDEKA